jgi:hypothetical protein
MWAEVGRSLSAVGPWEAVLDLVVVPVIAILGAIGILFAASKSRIREGEIRIRVLGITVRWGQPPNSRNEVEPTSPPLEEEMTGPGTETVPSPNGQKD